MTLERIISWYSQLNYIILLFFSSIKISQQEAKCLVALLHSKDSEMLEKALTTIGNNATFEENQVILLPTSLIKRFRRTILDYFQPILKVVLLQFV